MHQLIGVTQIISYDGNYEFDWEAKAVRKGYEDYEVVQSKARSNLSDPEIRRKLKER